jgi:ABC-2 type transport system permease protein
MMEFPVLFVSGLLVPLSALPEWLRPVGWLLAPTWGMRAVRAAALGGNPWPPMGVTVGLGAAYLVLGAFFLRLFLRLARERATLALT